MSKILVFGDSIAWGAWDKRGGWVERLREFIDKKIIEARQEFYCPVYNLSISGDTTVEILERLEPEAWQRFKEPEKENIFMFAVGSKDSEFIHSTGAHNVKMDQFEENIKKMIEISKKFTNKIIFVGSSPVDESKVDPIPWFPDASYKNEYIDQYDKIIEKVCRANGVEFIEIFSNMRIKGYEKLLEDGVHPNSEGHEKIFEIVKEYLLKNKSIEGL